MSQNKTAPAPFAAIVVAAGQGLRAGGSTPKQFAPYRGKPLLRHSVERLLAQGAERVCIAIPAGCEEIAAQSLQGVAPEGLAHDERAIIAFVTGGETRQASVKIALETFAASPPRLVLIHDAARPNLPAEVTQRLIDALRENAGAIPTLPLVDSVALAKDEKMAGMAKREEMRRVQTPQAFHFDAILSAHRAWQGNASAGDDAQVLHAAGGVTALVEGDERLKKITFASDLHHDDAATKGAIMRIGQGYDVHALANGEELWLCGVKIDHPMGLAGHSDADVALHAVVDAILGAMGDGDIGTHFPPSDPQWKGAASPTFVEHACQLMRKGGYELGNLDLTIICEAPKIGPHRDAMRQRLADITGAALDRISVKATTTEKLGFTGREEGIAAQAIVLLNQGELPS